jgi:hypothetical protein
MARRLQEEAEADGTPICATSVMKSGLRVSPVPCSPPV